jgi:hypothetical protein
MEAEMTDAEIRAQLAGAIEESLDDRGRAVLVASPEDGPPLMLVYRQRLTAKAIENVRRSWQEVILGPLERKVVILDDCAAVLQFIDGKWERLA